MRSMRLTLRAWARVLPVYQRPCPALHLSRRALHRILCRSASSRVWQTSRRSRWSRVKLPWPLYHCPPFSVAVVASLASLAFAALGAVSVVFTLSGLALALSSLALPVAVLSALAADVLAAGLGLAVDGFAVVPAGFVAVDDPVFLAVVFGLAAAADAFDVEDVFGVSSPELGVFAFATLKNLSDSDLISDVLHNLRRHLGRPSS